MINITPVILCGGSGSRLWPLSRTGFPKQFLCLTGQHSLFQQAAQRFLQLQGPNLHVAAPIMVTGEEHRFLATEQLRETGIPLGAALLEPTGRNTAPALTLAALAATQDGADPVLVVTPADQTITDTAAYTQSLEVAIQAAAEGSIVILGVTPDAPETGYGYIQVPTMPNTSGPTPVLRFVEKPNETLAKSYIADGHYFWNAGMFVLKASVWLQALAQFRPDILEATRQSWLNRTVDALFIRPGKAEFEAVASESVDYAVLEPCSLSTQSSAKQGHQAAVPRLEMVALQAGWSDLGAWDAVWKVLPKDADGNSHTGDVISSASRNTLVHATSRLVSLVGVENLIVIETPDAVLVANSACSQDVKQIVNQLGQHQRHEHTLHRKVHRPWGWYDSIDEGGRFKVKRIQVKPKASLSLQKHHHRAEHWVVVRGTAEITNGDKVLTLTENQSTYIPLGQVHRLANPGTIPLEIIEVQSGSYLGEDDIVRFEDAYGR
jgi:mannose-1-phosphate guanylyltransferase/mannose-6-phosphate isomerase